MPLHVSTTCAHHQEVKIALYSLWYHHTYKCDDTVHLSIFISVFNQLDAQNLFHNKFYFMPLHVSSTCADHQEVKIALHSLWYRHTETSEWSKITKIQFYNYEQIVVKLICEFLGCYYYILLSINMLCHVEVMFIQLLNILEIDIVPF